MCIRDRDEYLAWIATLEAGSEARRKMEGVPKYGEIVIDINHCLLYTSCCCAVAAADALCCCTSAAGACYHHQYRQFNQRHPAEQQRTPLALPARYLSLIHI